MSDLPYFVREPEGAAVPLLVSIPHCGTEVPEDLRGRLASDAVRALPDTDWHLEKLYLFAARLGAKTIHARYSRYVVDLNRAPDSRPLYPGRFETSLVPVRTFHGEPLYRDGEAPDEAEVKARREAYWLPYHRRLREELEALRARFGYALLFDAHSIQSEVPTLFEGRLPDLVLGTADGASAAPALVKAVEAVHESSGLGHATNHPFKGGYITRTYGLPAERIHALQLEMAKALYMNEGPPFEWNETKAERLEPVLEETLKAFLASAARHLG